MIKAYPRHSVDITLKEYFTIFSMIFSNQVQTGEYISIFEQKFAAYIGTTFAKAVPSARLGLYLLLKYLNLGENSEVIITPFTHQSIFTILKSFPLKPVFADIDKDTYNITPEQVEKLITPATKLVIITHMWGQPSQMDGFIELKNKYGFKIIEDCAMACGAEYRGRKTGSFGDASIFSFSKAKAISTFGGGMLCTDDKDIFDYIQKSTSGFKNIKYYKLILGIINSIIANMLTRPLVFYFTLYPVLRFLNIRDPYNPIEHGKDAYMILDCVPEEWKINLTDLQAAVGVHQLENLDRSNLKRQQNAEYLNKVLADVEGIIIPKTIPGAKHVYLYYALHVKKTKSLDYIREKLIKEGVDSQLNELTRPEQMEAFGVKKEDYPVFNKIADNLLIIPNGIYLAEEDINYVAEQCKKIFDAVSTDG